VESLFSAPFMPHIHCYLGKPELVWTMVVCDSLIGLAYLGISCTLWRLIRKIEIPFGLVVVCFGVFIGACGATHFMEVWTLWNPDYWVAAAVKVVTAIASVGTGAYLLKLGPKILGLAEDAKLSRLRGLELEEARKVLESRVRARTRELEMAIQARDEFLSIASHELKTPLTSLKLQAQLARRSIDRADDRVYTKDSVDSIVRQLEKQCGRLLRLVDDMLDIARFATGTLSLELEPVELPELVDDVLRRLEPQFAQAKRPKPRLSNESPEILVGYWDRLRIEQVLTNLLTNALRYGGENQIEVKIFAEDREAVFCVKDFGPGIAEEALDRIFSRFERAVSASEVSGLGLGLYISQQIVQAHGGTIRVESRLGDGATFCVALPRSTSWRSR
jgi:signal transduction histidine kinase